MGEQDKTFIWKVIRWVLGVFSTLMAAAIISLVTTARTVVFDVHDLKNNCEILDSKIDNNHSILSDRVYKIEQATETMRKEWREDQKIILEKLDKLSDKIK